MVNCERPGWDTYLALLSLTALGVVVVSISVNVEGAKDESVIISDGKCSPATLTRCRGTWKNFEALHMFKILLTIMVD